MIDGAKRSNSRHQFSKVDDLGGRRLDGGECMLEDDDPRNDDEMRTLVALLLHGSEEASAYTQTALTGILLMLVLLPRVLSRGDAYTFVYIILH